MIWDTRQLDSVLPQIWQALENGSRDVRHPFRTPVLGTNGPAGCALRTVVLRQADAANRLLACHTDYRTEKIRDLQPDPKVQWLFYHPDEKVQIRAAGDATIHHGDATAREAWERTPLPSRINYCTTAIPGTMIDDPELALPASVRSGELTLRSSEGGWTNFAVIHSRIHGLEFLQLNPQGHRRAAFTWSGDRFVGSWLVP